MNDDPVLVRLTKIAASASGMPQAFVTVVSEDVQRCVASAGAALPAVARAHAFCSHAVAHPTEPFIVEDASTDARFADSPLVTGENHIRFYVGIPIVLSGDQFAIGTICVVDENPNYRRSVDLDLLGWVATEVARRLEELADTKAPLARTRDLVFGLATGAAIVERGNITMNRSSSASRATRPRKSRRSRNGSPFSSAKAQRMKSVAMKARAHAATASHLIRLSEIRRVTSGRSKSREARWAKPSSGSSPT